MIDILICEDERTTSNLIMKSLIDEGYSCICAYTGRAAADLIEKRRFDLVLLEIMLPEINGYELLEYIRPTDTPAIFITTRGTVEDRIKGLKMGADDYIVKPFQMEELIARIEAVLRRFQKGTGRYEVLGIEIDTDSRTVKKDGGYIDLTVKEFDLLLELVRNKNVALYRDRLYESVWKEPLMGETRTLDSHIGRLRRKLDWENHIKTVFRIGYRLEV